MFAKFAYRWIASDGAIVSSAGTVDAGIVVEEFEAFKGSEVPKPNPLVEPRHPLETYFTRSGG